MYCTILKKPVSEIKTENNFIPINYLSSYKLKNNREDEHLFIQSCIYYRFFPPLFFECNYTFTHINGSFAYHDVLSNVFYNQYEDFSGDDYIPTYLDSISYPNYHFNTTLPNNIISITIDQYDEMLNLLKITKSDLNKSYKLIHSELPITYTSTPSTNYPFLNLHSPFINNMDLYLPLMPIYAEYFLAYAYTHNLKKLYNTSLQYIKTSQYDTYFYIYNRCDPSLYLTYIESNDDSLFSLEHLISCYLSLILYQDSFTIKEYMKLYQIDPYITHFALQCYFRTNYVYPKYNIICKNILYLTEIDYSLYRDGINICLIDITTSIVYSYNTGLDAVNCYNKYIYEYIDKDLLEFILFRIRAPQNIKNTNKYLYQIMI